MKVNESSVGVRGLLLLHSVDNSLQYWNVTYHAKLWYSDVLERNYPKERFIVFSCNQIPIEQTLRQRFDEF